MPTPGVLPQPVPPAGGPPGIESIIAALGQGGGAPGLPGGLPQSPPVGGSPQGLLQLLAPLLSGQPLPPGAAEQLMALLRAAGVGSQPGLPGQVLPGSPAGLPLPQNQTPFTQTANPQPVNGPPLQIPGGV